MYILKGNIRITLLGDGKMTHFHSQEAMVQQLIGGQTIPGRRRKTARRKPQPLTWRNTSHVSAKRSTRIDAAVFAVRELTHETAASINQDILYIDLLGPQLGYRICGQDRFNKDCFRNNFVQFCDNDLRSRTPCGDRLLRKFAFTDSGTHFSTISGLSAD